MNKLYEALEVCLSEIEQGQDVDTVLFRYPDLAEELRPILEVSIKAQEMAVPEPSEDIVRRNRAKLLQRAAEMREGQIAPVSRRLWSVPLRRAFVTLMVIAMLFISSTGLVRASSDTLPGDNLYPVKRTWEDLLVFFTFDTDKREELEFEHEYERLEELRELFAEGRSAEVDFAGYVTRLSDDEWRVSGITIFISPQTRLPGQEVQVGDAVRVRGQIKIGMSVTAEQVDLLPPGYRLPEVEDDEIEIEEEVEINEEPATESVFDAPVVPVTPEYTPEKESIEGVVKSVENSYVVVDGILMDIRNATVEGVPMIGAVAKAEGHYDIDGIFIVSKIEFRSIGVDDGNTSTNNNGNINSINDNDNDNDNDDNVNNNSNDNKSDDD